MMTVIKHAVVYGLTLQGNILPEEARSLSGSCVYNIG